MPTANITKVDRLITIVAKNPVMVRALVVDINGDRINQSGLSSVSVKVFNARTSVETYSATLTISSVVFNSLQTNDDAWTQDDAGYNFKHAIPGSAFPDGSAEYRVEYKFTPTVGDAWVTDPPIAVKTIHRFTA
jgi:hypothetical protein